MQPPISVAGVETAEAQGLGALLQEHPKLLQLFHHGALHGLWMWSLDDPTKSWVSGDFWASLGYGVQQAQEISKQWWRYVHPEDTDVAQEAFLRHIQDPSKPYDVEMRYQHRDGRDVWVRSRGMVVHDQHGEPLMMVGTHTDISEYKSLESQLRERTAQLEERNRELQQFAYAASHDLQAPARRILGFAEWLIADHGENLTDRGRTYLERIVSSATGMAQMSQGILRYSRLDREPPRMERVSLDAIVDDVVRLIDRDCFSGEDRGVQFDVYRDPLPEVLGDRNLLNQLFTNLIHNAIRYRSERHLRIHVRAEGEGRRCLVRVADNGIGFDAAHRTKIFGLFQRLHRQSEIPGTGLGLAMCRKIVECHGGQIWADGTPDMGATFGFTLPLPGPQGPV